MANRNIWANQAVFHSKLVFELIEVPIRLPSSGSDQAGLLGNLDQCAERKSSDHRAYLAH